jgi:hypothetical protein
MRWCRSGDASVQEVVEVIVLWQVALVETEKGGE